MRTVVVDNTLGRQFMDPAAFLKRRNLEHSKSRRGNYRDNAAARLLLSPQARADAARDLTSIEGGKAGRVRLHRDGLQSD